MEIKNMNVEELQSLQFEIKQELDLKQDYWLDIENIHKIEVEKESEIKQIKEDSYLFKSLEDAGYSVVIYGQNRIAIINYQLSKIENKYYGFEFEKSKILKKTRDDVSDAEFEKVQNILNKNQGN